MFGDIDLGMAWAVFRRNAAEYRRTWITSLVPNFFEPLLYLVGMGLGLGYYLSGGMEGQSYLAFIAPGLTASAAMNGASFETTYNMFVRMSYARLYDAYLSTPAQVEDVAVGEAMWASARALLYGAVFLLVSAGMGLFGYRLMSGPGVALMPLALLLIGATFALIGQLFTSFIRHIDLYSYYFTLWLTPLFLFSGIFFPVERFPAGESIAWFTPLYHAVRLCRGLMQGPLDEAAGVSALWMLVVCALLLRLVPARLRARLWR
ncbi:ABC transporter permease [Haliangium ochraceum]|uniref:Transport permease protein n=1 Tax=Haliangium ochraceum (strain DSM 14365 / JCM 11303 / SMP-2) TaxID=502025 RepID=D0LJQ1_HALO1|nr:ABC transporter permease [Haliangium ochraceum]ACY16625.1 ABC-2 type transporter [Haliangium ochraceum DSM 14365]